MSSKTDERNLYSVDIIKGIAIIMVIIVHSAIRFNLCPLLGLITQYGRFGCQAFFMLSGFTLTLSWESRNSHSLKRFYVRRYKSIAPGYYCTIALYYCINTILVCLKISSPFSTNRSLIGIMENVLLIHGLIPDYNNNIVRGGWYVGTIAVCYLLYPFIVKSLKKMYYMRKTECIIMPMILSLISLLIGFLIGSSDEALIGIDSFLYYNIINQISPFIMGIIACFIWTERKAIMNANRCGLNFGLWTIISLVMLAVNQVYLYALLPFTTGLSFVHLFLCLDTVNTEATRFGRLVAKVGKQSYGIYLLHPIIVFGLSTIALKISERYRGNTDTLIWCVCLPIMLVLSIILGTMYNKAINSMSKRLLRNV